MLISEERLAELVAGAPSNAVTLIDPYVGSFAILCKEDVVAAHVDGRDHVICLRGITAAFKQDLQDPITVAAVVCDLADRRSAKPVIWVRLHDAWVRCEQ